MSTWHGRERACLRVRKGGLQAQMEVVEVYHIIPGIWVFCLSVERVEVYNLKLLKSFCSKRSGQYS